MVFINLKLINFTTNELITQVKITNNENTQTIIKKIYAYLSLAGIINYIPIYTSLFADGQFLTENSRNIILDDKIIVHNLIFELEKKNYSAIQLNFLKDVNSEFFLSQLQTYQLVFPGIDENSFKLALDLILFEIDEDNYIEQVTRESQNILNDFEIPQDSFPRNLLNQIYQSEQNFDQLQLQNQNKLDISFLSVKYTNPNSYKNMFNIFNVFNFTILNSKFFLCSINGSYMRTSNPIIKIFQSKDTDNLKNDFKKSLINDKGIFKKIKGIIFKIFHNEIMYSLKMNSQGEVVISFDNSFKINSFQKKDKEYLISEMNNVYSLFVNYINSFKEIYPQNITLSSQFNIKIESLSADVTVFNRISKPAIKLFSENTYIRENLLSFKLIKDNYISCYYTKNLLPESKGITINIKDNQYVDNSSVISVFDCVDFTHIDIITKHLQMINDYILNNDVYPESEIYEPPQRIIKFSSTKELKQKKVDTSSKNCQGDRIPKVGNEYNPLPGAYDLVWKNHRYTCQNKDYKYPGFTNDNIVCCFKKDKRGTDRYVKNLYGDDLNIIVQASNYPIEVQNNNKTVQTILIKVVSGIENQVTPFYFLDHLPNSSHLSLFPILDQNIIDDIEELESGLEENETIWLDEVPLIHINSLPPKDKCSHLPNLLEEPKNFCSHHAKYTHFGFNNASYPCCFERQKEVVITDHVPIKTHLKHIINNTKILDFNRLGILHEFFYKVPIIDETFFRFGVIQNKDSFLNCVLASNIKPEIKSIINLKTFIIEKLRVDKKIRIKIPYFDSVPFQDFEKQLLGNYIDFNLLHEIVFYTMNVNIFIIDLDEENLNNSKIICNSFIDPSFKNIIFFKRNLIIANTIENFSKFELLVQIKNNNIWKSFDQNANIVEFFKTFYKFSCKNFYETPSNYDFTPFLILTSFKKYIILNNENKQIKIDKDEISFQLLNNYNKVQYIILKKYPALILPVEESIFIDNVSTNYIKKLNYELLPSYSKFVLDLNKFNQEYKFNIATVGILKSNDSFQNDGVLLNYNGIAIIKKLTENELDNYKDKILQNTNYYPTLYHDKFDFKENDYLTYYDKIQKNIYNVKTIVANNLNVLKYIKQKKLITRIVKAVNINNLTKFKYIFYNLTLLFNDFDIDVDKKKKLSFILKVITNEIILDAENMNIINNNVSVEQQSRSTSEIITNPDEILLIDTTSILSYFN